MNLAQRNRRSSRTLAASVVDERGRLATPAVLVGQVRVAPGEASVRFPARRSALVETPLYARTDGYLKLRNAEIGQHVKKGDLLVELDTPDLDQQIVSGPRHGGPVASAARAQIRPRRRSRKHQPAGATHRQPHQSLAAQGALRSQDADDADCGGGHGGGQRARRGRERAGPGKRH